MKEAKLPFQKRGWKYASIISTIIWTCIIWGHSLQPAVESSAKSGAITELLCGWLPWLTEHIVRKTAHFMEYAILGLLLVTILFILLSGTRKDLPLILLIGVVVPLLDESIQLFVPGRSGAVQDVLLDCSGILFGLAIGTLLFSLLLRVHRCKSDTAPCQSKASAGNEGADPL